MSEVPDNELPYFQAYAAIRVDSGPVEPPGRYTYSNGESYPLPGPGCVRVKEIVASAEEARREVDRLNALNGNKGCVYYWQATHVFLGGGSHGSSNRAN